MPAHSTVERLTSIVRGFRGRRVAVLGDLVADEFVYGDIARVSREAPVLILDHVQTVLVPGGGANSVANLRALGALPLPIGTVGRDDAGRGLLRAFRSGKIPVGGIVTVPGYATPSKSRIIAGGIHTRRQQVVRLDRGAPHGELPPRTAAALRRSLKTVLARAEGLLIADYGYGAASPAGLSALLQAATARGLPVTVDSRERITAFRGVTACTPNQEELEHAAGARLRDENALLEAGRKLLRRTGNHAILVTRGAAGMILFRKRQRPLHIPPYGSDEVADVTGAGDTVIAAFTLASIAGADAADAARIANYAAGLVVTKAGTATVTPAELVHAIREDAPS